MLIDSIQLSRRAFLRSGVAAGVSAALPARVMGAEDGLTEYRLRAGIARVRLAPEPFPATEVWTLNGQVPGPEIRVRQGDPLRVVVENGLSEGTTIHWHGMRVPNAMDGVPYLTQPPIAPDERYVYEYHPRDAGTYWYHSHANTAEQVGRGMYGPLIVEEREPITVDREITWVLDDWRLTREAEIKDDFHNPHDFSRAGRLGNTITVNGITPAPVSVRAGERLRIRIINAANARIFSLRFQGHRPTLIALDGQALEPFHPRGGAIQLGPAQRADVVVDMEGNPGERHSVLDTAYPQAPFRLLDLAYDEQLPLRDSPLDAPIRISPNPIQTPDLSDPLRQDIILEGGDLGRLDSASLRGTDTGISDLFILGKMWAINGMAGFRTVMPPLFTVPLGRTCVLQFQNLTAWPHPMHLHGHTFKVIEHDGDENLVGLNLDTVMLGPGERARVAFVADNPGDWLFHCHILSHAEAGMVAIVRVA